MTIARDLNVGDIIVHPETDALMTVISHQSNDDGLTDLVVEVDVEDVGGEEVTVVRRTFHIEVKSEKKFRVGVVL